MIVLHYTGMPDAQGALDRMTSPESKVSAHYMVDEDGTVYRLVDESKRAWHAGRSRWRGMTDINSASVGIEISGSCSARALNGIISMTRSSVSVLNDYWASGPSTLSPHSSRRASSKPTIV